MLNRADPGFSLLLQSFLPRLHPDLTGVPAVGELVGDLADDPGGGVNLGFVAFGSGWWLPCASVS